MCHAVRMRRADLARTIYDRTHLTGEFTLRSGVVSNEYFDKYLFESDPELLRAIAEALVPLVPDGTEALAGLELGGVPIAAVLSQVTGSPRCSYAKRRRPTARVGSPRAARSRAAGSQSSRTSSRRVARSWRRAATSATRRRRPRRRVRDRPRIGWTGEPRRDRRRVAGAVHDERARGGRDGYVGAASTLTDPAALERKRAAVEAAIARARSRRAQNA